MPNYHPIWSSVDQELTKIPSNGQNSISAFDNEIVLQYFDFLTIKKTELAFDFFIPNVDLSLKFKMVQESP